jgi:hypothetical protein
LFFAANVSHPDRYFDIPSSFHVQASAHLV